MNKKNSDIITLPTDERRRFIRHPLSIPISYKIVKKTQNAIKEKGLPAVTSNVSMGGLLFSTKHPVKVGSLIVIKLPFKDKIFNVQSKVVHCVKSPETKLYNVGSSFYRFTDAFKTKLVEQIYLIAEYRDLRSIQLGREISLEEASREWIERYAERFKRLYW
ncbi:MAG: PilZ domain-containing protein [Candidatus Omnitrophica bacterium]|nr:PilZ domain-containing protein [Candidatus Omnitrophota bacterium]